MHPELEQHYSVSCFYTIGFFLGLTNSGFFPFESVLERLEFTFTNSTFVSLSCGLCELFTNIPWTICQTAQTNIINVLPADKQMKIPVLLKPNASLIFTGRKDILNWLGKIYAPCTDNGPMSRCSCLLWGMGGIGKTQICLKFTEKNV